MSSEFEKAVKDNLEGIEAISVSLLSDCDICLSDNNCTADEIESGTAFDEGGFSWRPCDGCDSSLGGNRYSAHGIVNDEIIHFEVCEDCMLYLANGDLPNNWEG